MASESSHVSNGVKSLSRGSAKTTKLNVHVLKISATTGLLTRTSELVLSLIHQKGNKAVDMIAS